MTGYIAIPTPPPPFTRDSSRDFTIPNTVQPSFSTCGVVGGVLWILGYTRTPFAGSHGLIAYDISSTVPTRLPARDVFSVGGTTVGTSVGNKLVLFSPITAGAETSYANGISATLYNVGSTGPPSSVYNLRLSGGNAPVPFSHGNTVWVLHARTRQANAYTVQGELFLRDNLRDFTIPDSINVSGVNRGFFVGSTLYLVDWSGYGVTNTSACYAFDLPSGRHDPDKTFTLDGTNAVGIPSGLWAVHSSSPRTRKFFTPSGEGADPMLVRTPIDTIFYTDKDRHKIYPKKCWISRPASGGGLERAEWYTKDTSIPVISAFQSAPSEIDEDSSPPTNITLTWQTTGTVTRERITDLHRNANVPLSGNKRAVVARPLANTVYSLVATNGSFGSSTAKITVPVFKDCVINSFTVQYITNPLSPHGATVYFNINVTGKPRPTVSIDNGVGGANTHLTYDDDTGVLSGRIVHTFAGPRTFTATLTANNTQANGVAGPQATRTVQVIIP